MKVVQSSVPDQTIRQQIAALTSNLETILPRDTHPEGMCRGVFLKKVCFKNFPTILPPLEVLYDGQKTSVRLRLRSEWYQTVRPSNPDFSYEEIPGADLGGSVHDSGIYLAVFGSLLQVRQDDRYWFELMHPKRAFFRLPLGATFVPQARFEWTPVGITLTLP